MLEQLIKKGGLSRLATAKPAKLAKVRGKKRGGGDLATLATLAVATDPNCETETGCQEPENQPQKSNFVASAAGSNPENEEWDAIDYQAYFDEHAAVDGGLDRSEAKQRAFEATVIYWLNATPPQNINATIALIVESLQAELGRIRFLSLRAMMLMYGSITGAMPRGETDGGAKLLRLLVQWGYTATRMTKEHFDAYATRFKSPDR